MRSEELWLVQENHATLKPGWSSSSPRGMKTYSDGRIEYPGPRGFSWLLTACMSELRESRGEPEFIALRLYRNSLMRWKIKKNLWDQGKNWAAKSKNFEENAGKVKKVFVLRVAMWAKKLGRCLKYFRSWKNTLGKLVVAVNLEAIWFEFEWR